MIIKKFQGATENEAIEKARDEFGSNAVVMNIKETKPKGIFHLFRKPVVEVTAALDEKAETTSQKEDVENTLKQVKKEIENQKTASAIEKKLDILTNILEEQGKKEEKPSYDEEVVPQQEHLETSQPPKKQVSVKEEIQTLMMNQLLNNEVEEKYASMLIQEVEHIPDKEEALDVILSNVYQRIVLKLGQPEIIDIEDKKTPRICFFVGSTGVGKTTTIAKIASMFKLEKKIKVALITSDTYRIAAVEQLKTYANILSVPIRVVYTPDEMKQAVEDYCDYDLIIVDTAGRSHKNKEQYNELRNLINSVDESLREVYLVLSATTKYKDMKQITNVYSDIKDYRLIFTKLDETCCYGNILNIRMETGAPLSYVTCGQNVPDDISVMNAQAIAKQLIGGCE